MSTQIELARKGLISPEMAEVAKRENRTAEFIRDGLASGKIVIPKNKARNFTPEAIGEGLRIKINANIGTSELNCNLPLELQKLKVAVETGAHSVMDLSTGGQLDHIREQILKHSPVMVGTVPIYGLVAELVKHKKDVCDFTADDLFHEIEKQAAQGVDFMTLHCGVTQDSIRALEKQPRVAGIVSRGGSLMKRWMLMTGRENPLYERYDDLLDICYRHDVTISLGDGLRPGAGADAGDAGQMAEVLVLGELVQRAREKNVQTMVEGPGHVPIHQVAANIKSIKALCHQAPLYVLGPLTTDIAAGYDHIAGAIGGAIAAMNGANFLCYVTPAEHLTLPNLDDVKQGVMASRIAAHSADIGLGLPQATEPDLKISQARRALEWETIYENCMDPALARQRKEAESQDKEYCSMCGELCAVKNDRPIEDKTFAQ